VRIYLHIGPFRKLETRNPSRIAEALCRSPHVKRSDGVISALLYATHALGIPVRLGIDRVARSQAFFWSVRHSLSGFECAILLSKWLASVQESMHETPLSGKNYCSRDSILLSGGTDNEDRILYWVQCLVEEASAVVDFTDDKPNSQADPDTLGSQVLKIWSCKLPSVYIR
jgi:hypothetical protein